MLRLIAMTRLGLALGVLVLAASACGTQTGTSADRAVAEHGHTSAAGRPTATTTGGPAVSGTGMEGPPPFRLRYPGHELVLRPHTWCYRTGCVDGVVIEDPPSVGSPAALRVRVPVEDWQLVATFTPAGERCGRQQSVTPARDGEWYLLEPAGPAGSYHVDLFAQGTGDMAARFRWDTPADGALATPKGRLALIADHDGLPDSYGVELMLENLATTPRMARARITVTAANGRSLTFEGTRSEQGCWPEGTVYFDGPDAEGRAAAALGEMPFRYAVAVRLDGTTYRATADYPADQIPGNEPSVALRFSPALPALR